MTRFFLVVLALVAGVVPGRAEITTKPVAYKHGMTALEGLVVADSTATGKRPGVLLAHELGAASAQAKSKAMQLAKLGYVVFSLDLYGKGVTPRDAADAAAKLGLTGKDRTLVRERTAAARAALEKVPHVDPKHVAAVGYGIGGTAVLELARSRAVLDGVVCVHGDLTPTGEDGKNISAALLILVGADDPKVPLAQVAAFEEEMRKGGVDWQLVRYGGVGGDFTNPQAGRDLRSGRAYDPDADQRAADAIRVFLGETFPLPARTLTPATRPPAPRGIPDKVLKVLEYVDKHGEAMDGYEGGRTFGNFERQLRITDAKGRRIKYREWDVNPLRPGVNRGAERLITGSDGGAYYTNDHYSTFTRIR
jgi:dienelactone hydrolase